MLYSRNRNFNNAINIIYYTLKDCLSYVFCNSHVGILTPKEIAQDGDNLEDTQITLWDPLGEINCDGGSEGTDWVLRNPGRKAMWMHTEHMVVYKPGNESCPVSESTAWASNF